jgi:hypothetical protein
VNEKSQSDSGKIKPIEKKRRPKLGHQSQNKSQDSLLCFAGSCAKKKYKPYVTSSTDFVGIDSCRVFFGALFHGWELQSNERGVLAFLKSSLILFKLLPSI